MDIKRGDLEPALKLVVEDAAGVANLNQVASWRVIGSFQGQVIVNGAPDTVVVDPQNSAKATLTRAWLAGETNQVGDMAVEVEAMWPGNRPQTFPANGQETVRFKADLG